MAAPMFLLALAGAARAERTVELSSAAISDPHQLVGPVLSTSAAQRRLTVFPENLVYNVTWGIFDVGTASLEVEDVVDFNGRPAYHIISRALSNGWTDTFYKVRDINESWLDAQTMVSLGYSKKLREGHYFRDEWALYDHREGAFLAKITGRDGDFQYYAGTAPISVQDILSGMYYVRSQPLVPGQDVVLDVNTRQNWPLLVHVVRKERVKTPAGKFDAVLVEPALRQEGLFIQKGRRLQLWLTDDDRRMPVQMKVEVFFGHISAKLSKML